MNDRSEFLRAIEAAPNDDAPRLVFADWLDETNDPLDAAHAELIRLQIKLAQAEPLPRWEIPKETHDSTREKQLIADYLPHWRKRWGVRLYNYGFSRGFPCPVGVTYNRLCRGGDKLAQALPLHAVRITTADYTDIKCPTLRFVRGLSFPQYVFHPRDTPDQKVDVIVNNQKYLKNLTYLCFASCHINVERAERLAKLRLPNLTCLSVWYWNKRSRKILQESPLGAILR